MKLRQGVMTFYYFYESDEREKRELFVNLVILHTSEINNIEPGVLKVVNIKCSPDSVCPHPECTHIHLCQCGSFSPLLSFPLSKLALCEYKFGKSKSRTLSLLPLDKFL